jgi:hypothetical protein
MFGGKALLDIAKEICLRVGMQAEGGLVKKQNDPLSITELGEGGQKRKEPLKAGRPLREVQRDEVAKILDSNLKDRLLIFIGRVLNPLTRPIDVERDPKLLVLAPVLENLA